MAKTGQLSELFIDLTLRGDVQLASLKTRVAGLQEALDKSGAKYRGNTREQMNDLMKIAKGETEIAKLDERTYQSKRYRVVANKVVEADQARARASEAKHYALLRAQSNGVAASLSVWGDKLGTVRDRVSSIANLGGSGLNSILYGAAGVTGAYGLVSAASPDAINTLTGSFRLLAAEVGQSLIPAVVIVSAKVQQLAQWWRELDPNIKSTIASFAMWTAAGFGVVMVGGRIVATVISIGQAMASMLAVGAANPLVITILAVAAAVAILTAALHLLSTQNQRGLVSARGVSQRLDAGGALTSDDYARLPASLRARLDRAPNQQAHDSILRDAMASNSAQMAANASAAAAAPGAAAARGQMANSLYGMATTAATGDLTGGSGGVGSFLLNRGTPLGLLSQIFSAGARDSALGPATNQANMGAQQSVMQALLGGRTPQASGATGSAGRPGNPDMAYSSSFQSQFGSFEQNWRRVQQAAASGGSLESRLLELQTQGNQHLLGIENNTRPWFGGATPPSNSGG